jgi:pimeloyl-ACP methyl ester carboxylesterase
MNFVMRIVWTIAVVTLCCSCSQKDEDAAQSAPRQQYTYVEREVSFQNEQAGIRLVGTLTIPNSSPPLIAVILVQNCSADRDETVGRHRPFKVLAAHLAQNGMVVMRADSRGIGQSEGQAWPACTKRDIASDIEAAIIYLKNRTDTGSLRIGLVGHSWGANVATMVAARSSNVAFVVMLGGQGLPGGEVLCMQIRSVARVFGAGQLAIDKRVQLIEATVEVLRTHTEENLSRAELGRLFDDYLRNTTDAERLALTKSGYPIPDNPEDYASGVLLPWMKDFLLYDPQHDLSRVECPLLSLIGEKDMQVHPRENSAAIKKALLNSGNKDYSVRQLPGLNHLFQMAKTGSPAEYQIIDKTISPSALKVISTWIHKQIEHK